MRRQRVLQHVQPLIQPTGPTVSVIVSTYRRVERLVDCLNGLRSQTRSPDEVIVVVRASDQESAAVVEVAARGWPALRYEQVELPGVVAAYNLGLALARGEIVAYVDDDAVPRVDWLERIVTAFAHDDLIAGVGGRDVIMDNGRVWAHPRAAGHRAPSLQVGKVRWFGRVTGNHHIGEGPPRDVDVLKGVNMSFRRSAAAEVGFDARLRGQGAQMHTELSICLPLRRRGLRLVYDPKILVNHFPSVRPYGDQRADGDPGAAFAAAHNEALPVLEYLGPRRRLIYAAWGLFLGAGEAPGIAVLVRDTLRRRPGSWAKFRAAQRGRWVAWGTRRKPRRGAASPRAVTSRSPDGHSRHGRL